MRRLNILHCIYLFFLPWIFADDCQEICSITVNIMENTSREQLQWNLDHLLVNRTRKNIDWQYSLSNPSEYFYLHSSMIYFRLPELDREEICKNYFAQEECVLHLQIFTQTSFVILLKFLILDDNDWKPFFLQDSIQLIIRENLPNEYQVQLPIAYDYDSSEYNIDSYILVNQTEEMEGIFQLEKSEEELRLKLLTKFDCETKNNYQLFLQAIDKGGLQSNILHVNITVGDLNEYQPRFTQRFYHTRIPENLPMSNASILQITAIDDDCNDQIIHYFIINHEYSSELLPFIIDKYTGSISVQSELDYESISTYRFRVKASNVDEMTSSVVPVMIDILDINDNPPMIQLNILNDYKFNENKENLMININENIRLGQVIGTVLIRDMDSTITNHRLSLNILSCLPLTSTCPIELDSGMGNLTFHPTAYLIRISRALDRELGDEKIMIIFEARDYGNPSLTSQYRLIMNINDENDCRPEFTKINYQFQVSNSSPIGSLIGQVQAFDEDFSSKFHRIQYQFLPNENQDIISIDPENGNLFLLKSPFQELQMNLTVVAIDQHNHSLYDQTNITLFFYDETKCSPGFNQTIYVFNTTEHQRTPYELGHISVSDCSLASIAMSYLLIEESSSFPFSLDADTGIIKVVEELDREIQSFYKFSVHLLNSNIQAEVHIHILDINDQYPRFNTSQEQYIYISPQYSPNDPIFITNIFAIDADLGLNGLVHYYFTNQDLDRYFHLYPNGSLVLYNPNIYLPIRLEIYARDHGYPKALTSQENLVVYICDIYKRNDCSSSTLRRNFYLGSIFIMISIVAFLMMIIICIFWNLFLKNQSKRKENNQGYHGPVEGRKSLIVPENLYEPSPLINGDHRMKCLMV